MNIGKRIIDRGTVLGVDDNGSHVFHLKEGQEIEVVSFNKRFATVRVIIDGEEVTVTCVLIRTLSHEI